MKLHKAPGESGLAAAHLRFLNTKHPTFVKNIAYIFNFLIDCPSAVKECKNLYQFRPVFLPKPDGGFRPIAI